MFCTTYRRQADVQRNANKQNKKSTYIHLSMCVYNVVRYKRIRINVRHEWNIFIWICDYTQTVAKMELSLKVIFKGKATREASCKSENVWNGEKGATAAL